jgi:hypothetical protein
MAYTNWQTITLNRSPLGSAAAKVAEAGLETA